MADPDAKTQSGWRTVLILIAGIIVAAGIIWIMHALSEMVRTLSFV